MRSDTLNVLEETDDGMQGNHIFPGQKLDYIAFLLHMKSSFCGTNVEWIRNMRLG